jgi:hypothetical protein
MAEEMRARAPTLTAAQAFARVFEANPASAGRKGASQACGVI